jgi:hypothetical protein
MKKIYKKPIIEVIYVNSDYKILTNSNDEEPQVTEFIGAKENNLLAEDDEED